MKNENTHKGRIEFLKQREADIRAQIAAEQMKKRRRIEKDNVRLFSIVGAALVQDATQHPETSGLNLRQILNTAVTEERSRDFLKSQGWLQL